MVQLLYLALVIGGTLLYWSAIHPHLPGPYLSPVHRYSGAPANRCTPAQNTPRWVGPICPLVLIVMFWIARFSDPGVVTQLTLHHQYAHDGVLWTPKPCQPCGWQRPARAKHCDTCGHCIARYDHHCVWINNCVGLGNTLHFVAFLGANVIVCFYGALWCVSVCVSRKTNASFDIAIAITTLPLRHVGGAEVHGRRAQATGHTAAHGVGRASRPPSATDPQATAAGIHRAAESAPCCASVHPDVPTCAHIPTPQAALLLLLFAGGAVLSAFLAQHMWLVCHNVTTYELIKWRHLRTLVDQLQHACVV